MTAPCDSSEVALIVSVLAVKNSVTVGFCEAAGSLPELP